MSEIEFGVILEVTGGASAELPSTSLLEKPVYIFHPSLDMVHLISAKGYIEREVVAEIYHYSNYSTFEFRKGESEHTLWEGNKKKCCIIIYMHIINIA